MGTLGIMRIFVLLGATFLFFIFSRRVSKNLLHGYVLIGAGVGLSLVLLNLFIGTLFYGALLREDWRQHPFPITEFIGGYIGQTVGLMLLLAGTYHLVRSLQPHLDAHYSSLVEHSLVGVYLIQGGVLKFVNPRFAETFGYQRQELLGKSIFDLVAPQSRALVTENICKRVNGLAQSLHYQFVAARKNGHLFDAEVYDSPTVYKGKPAVHATLLDVTERKRAEEALHASERRLRESLAFQQRLIASLPTIAFVTSDLSGIVTSFSPGAEQIFGYLAEDIVGEPITKLHLPEEVVRPPDLMQGQVGGQIGFSGEITLVRKNGEEFPAHFITSTILDEGGKVLALLGVAQDITERKLAEAQLRKLSCAVEQSPSSVVITDTAGNIEYVNPKFTQTTGYTPEEVIGKNPRFLKSGNTSLQQYKKLWETISAGNEWRGELCNRKKNGELYWEFVSISLISNSEGVVTHFLAVQEDITERRRAEEALLQTQKLESLGVLAGGIAHDFNNLLVGILGNTGLALLQLPAESPVHDTIEQIEVAGKRAAELIRQMLAYSGRGRFAIQRLNLNTMIEEMSHLLKLSISKNAILQYNFARDLAPVEADATQIRQVIMNLVLNASEAIGDNSGVITISTGAISADRDFLTETYLAADLPEGDYVYLEVSDTGCGMDAETQTRMFDPFFTTKFTGRGLGLAAVLGIVRGHKGTLKVRSKAGHGTIFKILLPCAMRTAEPIPVADASPAGWRVPDAAPDGTVLVVDDEETVRNVSARILQQLGFSVLLAADGRAGIDMFRSQADRITCILLDMTMPYPNGEEVFREIRRLRPEARVILMSGYSEQEATSRFVGKGLAGFLQKPYTPQDLREKLLTALQEK